MNPHWPYPARQTRSCSDKTALGVSSSRRLAIDERTPAEESASRPYLGHGERPKPSPSQGNDLPAPPGSYVFFSICVGLKTIVSPQVLPYTWRTKFSTLIRDVAKTGNSGSGVFDPNHKVYLASIVFIPPE